MTTVAIATPNQQLHNHKLATNLIKIASMAGFLIRPNETPDNGALNELTFE